MVHSGALTCSELRVSHISNYVIPPSPKWNKRNTKDVGPNKDIPQGSDNHSLPFFFFFPHNFATGPFTQAAVTAGKTSHPSSPISLHQADSDWLNSSIILLEAFLTHLTPRVCVQSLPPLGSHSGSLRG